MNEPLEMAVERSVARSAQALLLARVFATVLTLVLLVVGLFVCSTASKFGAMFAELDADAQLPVISGIALRHSGGVAVALMVMSVITAFFIWGKGKAGAWIAGLGLLLMAGFVPIMVFALFIPLTKIVSEMQSM
ncbi:hypothetical protein OKA05_19850 [Luteolibacter arcticus]|uniref:TrbC/VIRB2 family protein n=1 Tax=Luteolibacter arcticus TaxID=1581411 RepID=A0ABT3GMU8_9BACT|nr:hypothetical protein [Luteolibacter arcticus]MCW1924828.1 hypothetical protein [Luteolibacter arcticus]